MWKYFNRGSVAKVSMLQTQRQFGLVLIASLVIGIVLCSLFLVDTSPFKVGNPRLPKTRFISQDEFNDRWQQTDDIDPLGKLPKEPIKARDFPRKELYEDFWDAAMLSPMGSSLKRDTLVFAEDMEVYEPRVVASEGAEKHFVMKNIPLNKPLVKKSDRFSVEYTIPKQTMQRGVVTCAGGKDFLSSLLPILLFQKKQMKSKFPYHIFYVGEEEMPEEANQYIRDVLFKEFNNEVTFSDISKMITDHSVKDLRHFRVKAFALMQSPFKESIYMDADMWTVFQALDVLFEDSDYQERGLGLFHDRFFNWKGNAPFQKYWAWNMIGHKCEGDPVFCAYNCQNIRGISPHDGHSALIVLKTDWESEKFMQYVTYLLLMNHKDSAVHHSVYSWTWGDKETFWMARERAGLKYIFFDSVLHFIGIESAEKRGEMEIPTSAMLSMYKEQPIGVNKHTAIYRFTAGRYSHYCGLVPTPYTTQRSFSNSVCNSTGIIPFNEQQKKNFEVSVELLEKTSPEVDRLFP
eukprot:Nk52_evm11s221 gene=Nk52_evmTU11s221